MHTFSKNDSHDDGFVAPSPASPSRPSRNSLMYDYTGGQVHPRSPLPARDPAQEIGGERGAPVTGDRVHAADYAAGAKHRQETAEDGTLSDSGYSSASPRNAPRTMPAAEHFESVPVVWSGPKTESAAHGQEEHEQQHDEDSRGTPQPHRRTQELVSGSVAAAETGAGAGSVRRMGMGEPRRSQSMRSFRQSTADPHYDDAGSARATPLGRRTPRRRTSLNNGSFANGAGMIGANAHPSEEETSVFRSRSINADAGLTKKQRLKIGKTECALY